MTSLRLTADITSRIAIKPEVPSYDEEDRQEWVVSDKTNLFTVLEINELNEWDPSKLGWYRSPQSMASISKINDLLKIQTLNCNHQIFRAKFDGISFKNVPRMKRLKLRRNVHGWISQSINTKIDINLELSGGRFHVHSGSRSPQVQNVSIIVFNNVMTLLKVSFKTGKGCNNHLLHGTIKHGSLW